MKSDMCCFWMMMMNDDDDDDFSDDIRYLIKNNVCGFWKMVELC